MVFMVQIENEDKSRTTVFDIEFFQNKMDYDIDLWHSEIQITTVPNGIIDLIERLTESSKFNKDELKTDCAKITDLWWWLWKQTEYGYNDSVTSDKADKRHYHVFLPHVKEVLKEFCDKYNLYLNED